jgi:peptidoglycan/xylan/chitin deacetylase (PgdA/CDA1 family)
MPLTGCGQPLDPIERLGRKAAERVGPEGAQEGGKGGAPPARVPVLDRVPTRDRVVFLTYDDGVERDPRFVDMVRRQRLPVVLFLTDSVLGPGYGHFARLRAVGATLENHTLDHTALRGLPYAGQRAEICGQQEKLHARFGVRPRLFRPPYGTYDATTLRAAGDCGISALILWRVSVDDTGALRYAHGERALRPGDIVTIDTDETTGLPLRERTARLLRDVEAAGLKPARLQRYVSPPRR